MSKPARINEAYLRHRARVREYFRQKRQKRLQAGMCAVCGERPPRVGFGPWRLPLKTCAECAKVARIKGVN